MHFHVEAAGASGHHPADPAHADDAEPFAGDLGADHERRAPMGPLAAAHQAVALAGAAGRAQQQQHGDFGRRVGQHVRRVGDDDAARLQGRQVAMIDADRMIGDDFEPIRQPGDQIGAE